MATLITPAQWAYLQKLRKAAGVSAWISPGMTSEQVSAEIASLQGQAKR